MARKKKATATIDAGAYDYKTTKVRDKDGRVRHSVSNGDAVAKAMLNFVAAGKDLMQLVRANKLDQDKFNPKRFTNTGMFRMTLGNSLRAMVRAGTAVDIGGTVIKTLNQRVAVEEAKTAPRKAAA